MTHFFKVKLTYKSFHIFCLVSQLIIKEKRKERGDFIIEKSFVPSKQLFALCKLFFHHQIVHFLPANVLHKYLQHKMVFCYQNCSDQLWEKNVLVIENFFFEIRGWRPRICKNLFEQHSSLVDYLVQVINAKNCPTTFYCIS